MLMITYDSKFREIPNKTTTCFGVLLFLPPRTHMGITIQNHVPGSFSIKKQLLRRDPLEKNKPSFLHSLELHPVPKKEMVTKAQTALSLHPSSSLSQRCQAISGAGSIRHLASWPIISDGLGWRAWVEPRRERHSFLLTRILLEKNMGDLGVTSPFLFFEEGFWKKHVFWLKTKWMNEIKLFVLEGWILMYLISFHWRHTAGCKKVNCYTKSLLCQNILYQKQNSDQIKNAKILELTLTIFYQLVVSTHLKNIGQIGSFPQVREENNNCLKPPPSISQYLSQQKPNNIRTPPKTAIETTPSTTHQGTTVSVLL